MSIHATNMCLRGRELNGELLLAQVLKMKEGYLCVNIFVTLLLYLITTNKADRKLFQTTSSVQLHKPLYLSFCSTIQYHYTHDFPSE